MQIFCKGFKGFRRFQRFSKVFKGFKGFQRFQRFQRLSLGSQPKGLVKAIKKQTNKTLSCTLQTMHGNTTEQYGKIHIHVYNSEEL